MNKIETPNAAMYPLGLLCKFGRFDLSHIYQVLFPARIFFSG